MRRILALLLIKQATAEWVEISQKHYQKPIRTHSPFTTPEKVIDAEDTTTPWIYNNRSMTEYNWNKNPARPPNLGNVKRVQHIESTIKTTDRIKLEEDDIDLHVNFSDYELKPDHSSTRATIELRDKQKGSIERVPNVGNIKRVQLNTSPVKSPAVNYKGDREKYLINRPKNNLHVYDHHITEANDFEHKNSTEAYRRIYINQLKYHHGSERTATFPPDDDDGVSFTEEVTTYNVMDFYSKKPTFITETEDLKNYETQKKRFYKIINSKSSNVTDKINDFTTEINTEGVTKISTTLTKPTTAKTNKNNIQKNENDLKAESHENKVQVSRNDEKPKNAMVNDHKTKQKGCNDQLKRDHEHDKENFKGNKDKKYEATTSTKTEKNKVNTMENVIKFMRVVADTISKNSRRSFGGKIQYLHELKESILANIEKRIDATWPDDDSAGVRRRSRSAHASPRGHVQFPSSESALMTISFLTFAVFLIKLVLQVIQTYKQKAMVVAPLMVASGRKVFTHNGHH